MKNLGVLVKTEILNYPSFVPTLSCGDEKEDCRSYSADGADISEHSFTSVQTQSRKI